MGALPPPPDHGTPGEALTASFGVGEWRASEDIWAAVGRADVALYAAKQSGRNRIAVGEPQGPAG